MFDLFKTEELNNKEIVQLKEFFKKEIEDEFLPPEQLKGEFLLPPISFARLKKVYIFLIFLIFLFLARIYYFQIIKGEYYKTIVQNRYLKTEFIKPYRGIFYDRNQVPLVKNTPSFSLNVIPANLPKDSNKYNELIEKLIQILPKEKKDEFLENLKDLPKYSNDSIPILRGLNYKEAILLKIKLAEIKGFEISLDSQREYLDPFSFSHLLGYVGKISKEELSKNINYSFNDVIGKTGLEYFYEKDLRGERGERKVEVSHFSEEVLYSKPPKSGDNLYLTIDNELQKKIYEVLVDYVKKSNGKGAAAIALNPNNGEVLAIVSYPSFDNNLLTKGLTKKEFEELINNPNKPLFNRAISGEYPSGSIIKPILALAGLEEGIITPQTTILSTGGISLGKWFFPDWKKTGHGLTNVKKALAESVNTFFYYVGGGYGNFKGLGVEKIFHWLSLFNLNNLTNIDLPNEKKGFIPTPEWKEKIKNEPWYPGDTYHLSIGQGYLLVTPIQVAVFTAALANNGYIYQPYLVKEIRSSSGEIKKHFEPKIIRKISFKMENLEIVKEGLRQAVISGTARRLFDLPFEVAGKTGTAESFDGKPHAWFTCFAPFKDPKIVLTILIENGGEGSSTAVPAAKEILSWWFSHKFLNKKQD